MEMPLEAKAGGKRHAFGEGSHETLKLRGEDVGPLSKVGDYLFHQLADSP
jgi:hypothetical protein